MTRAIGISIHTGWGACVVTDGSLRKPQIVHNTVIELLEGAERFCFHRAAEMQPPLVKKWLASLREKALAQARNELAPLLRDVSIGALVAKDGILPDLQSILSTHMRIHSAEGLFYRDVFREACGVPCHIVSSNSLNIATLGKLATQPPWGRDQKLAALAALQLPAVRSTRS
jgi:hypothetical protein